MIQSSNENRPTLAERKIPWAGLRKIQTFDPKFSFDDVSVVSKSEQNLILNITQKVLQKQELWDRYKFWDKTDQEGESVKFLIDGKDYDHTNNEFRSLRCLEV